MFFTTYLAPNIMVGLTIASGVILKPNINPLSPHDALKHRFTSLKTDLIFQQLGVLK